MVSQLRHVARIWDRRSRRLLRSVVSLAALMALNYLINVELKSTLIMILLGVRSNG